MATNSTAAIRYSVTRAPCWSISSACGLYGKGRQRVNVAYLPVTSRKQGLPPVNPVLDTKVWSSADIGGFRRWRRSRLPAA